MTTHYERRGDVAVLQIDNPPINGLGHATRKALIGGMDPIEAYNTYGKF